MRKLGGSSIDIDSIGAMAAHKYKKSVKDYNTIHTDFGNQYESEIIDKYIEENIHGTVTKVKKFDPAAENYDIYKKRFEWFQGIPDAYVEYTSVNGEKRKLLLEVKTGSVKSINAQLHKYKKQVNVYAYLNDFVKNEYAGAEPLIIYWAVVDKKDPGKVEDIKSVSTGYDKDEVGKYIQEKRKMYLSITEDTPVEYRDKYHALYNIEGKKELAKLGELSIQLPKNNYDIDETKVLEDIRKVGGDTILPSGVSAKWVWEYIVRNRKK